MTLAQQYRKLLNSRFAYCSIIEFAKAARDFIEENAISPEVEFTSYKTNWQTDSVIFKDGSAYIESRQILSKI